MVDEQLSTAAAERIRVQILDGTLPTGSRLPAERVLSEEFGISRTALRDALQTLEATGFVEVRAGRGRYVTDGMDRGGPAAALSWVILHRNDLESLNEVRELLEPRAVSSTPPDSVAKIAAEANAIVEQQLQAIMTGQLVRAADLDGDFHTTLISATPNVPLRELAGQLISMARIHAARVYGVPGVAAHSVSQHEDIVKALRSGDVAAAAELVRHHAHTAYRTALDEAAPGS